ncbi:hypothetical protein GCM10009864_30340 [Streptomyces lunalinharesii]|uniref:Uncharacterized protein n=1 Tax=Streptomyces lunalinharesii TaxID=333384 RepID=A0ABN3RUG0_9ACTN
MPSAARGAPRTADNSGAYGPAPAPDPQCSGNILKAIFGSAGFPHQFRGKIFAPAPERAPVLCGRGKLNEMRGRKAVVVTTLAAALRAERPDGTAALAAREKTGGTTSGEEFRSAGDIALTVPDTALSTGAAGR